MSKLLIVSYLYWLYLFPGTRGVFEHSHISLRLRFFKLLVTVSLIQRQFLFLLSIPPKWSPEP